MRRILTPIRSLEDVRQHYKRFEEIQFRLSRLEDDSAIYTAQRPRRVCYGWLLEVPRSLYERLENKSRFTGEDIIKSTAAWKMPVE